MEILMSSATILNHVLRLEGTNLAASLCLIAVSWSSFPALTSAEGHGDKPNMLVIWGDDIGMANVSAYTMGLMGYRTPNIDRIADEGMLFTDYYGEQSCDEEQENETYVKSARPVKTVLIGQAGDTD